MPEKAATHEARILLAMVAVIAVPALITLATIREPRTPITIPADPLHNPSPYGYTWSLLLFVIPCSVLTWWLHSVHRGPIERKAFWVTMGVMVPLWCLLDVFFGLMFFKFPNLGASVGTFWGYTFDHGWQKVIPIEEIGFYVFGIMAMLLVYVWGDEYFVAAYSPKRNYTSAELRRIVSFHPASALVGVAAFAAAWLFKAFSTGPAHAGFPGYFLFLLLGSVLPSILFFDVARAFINWRALAMTGALMAFVSLFWEASVAVPYQWWDYNHDQMIGVFVGPLTDLPIEAVLLWVSSTWCSVILYETIQAFLRMERRDVEGLFSSAGASTDS